MNKSPRLQRPRNAQGLPDLRRRHRHPVRPWPLLRPGQDPDSLEARVAFHLHRLRLTGKRLRDASGRHDHSDLVQARITLTAADVAVLAHILGLAPDDLSREPTSAESSEWRFYRYSAFNAGEVWQRAARLWRARGYSDKQAATFMGIDPALVVKNLKAGNRTGNKVLTFHRVARLLAAIGAPGDPDQLIAGLSLAYVRNRPRKPPT